MSTTFEALQGNYGPTELFTSVSSCNPHLGNDRDSVDDYSDGASSISGDEEGGNLIAVESICKIINSKSFLTSKRRRLTKKSLSGRAI